MLNVAAQHGLLDKHRVVLETFTALQPASADLILTYHALDAACCLKD